MSLIRWKPWHELDELLENTALRNGFTSDLATDVYENNGNVVVKMHIPDIDPEKINIEIEGHHLYVSGSREEKKEVEKEHYYKKEIRSGYFERTIDLPCKIDESKVSAESKNGVLQITLPKKSTSETHKITVSKK